MDVSQNKSTDCQVLLFIEILPPHTTLTSAMIQLQCSILISLIKQSAPVKNKKVDCHGELVSEDKILVQVLVHGNYPQGTVSASNYRTYNFSLLIIMIVWVVNISL